MKFTRSGKRLAIFGVTLALGYFGLAFILLFLIGWQLVALQKNAAKATPSYTQVLKIGTSLHFLVSWLHTITLDGSSSIGCLKEITALAPLATTAQEQALLIGESYQTSGSLSISPVAELLPAARQHLAAAAVCLNQKSLLTSSLSGQQLAQLKQNLNQAEIAVALISSVAESSENWVVMFQNSTELRPTGGFTGSYALVELSSGTIHEIQVEDIYDADGQVTRFREAPPGVAEYTSGDNGLRLPDANWWPDFPTSARAQLDFLAQAGKRNLGGLVALNVSLLEDILRITGPIALPDYQTELNADNATTLLRAHADQFFPGSADKKNMVRYAMLQLAFQIGNLSPAEQQKVAQTMLTALATKDVQIYFLDEARQQQLSTLGYANSFETAVPKQNLLPVLAITEANVGINKSNAFVTRQATVTTSSENMTVSLELRNTADQLQLALPTSQSAYVAYLRLLTTPGIKLASSADTSLYNWITLGGTEVADHGQLVTVLPGESKSISWQLTRDKNIPFIYWHQSGTGSYPLTLKQKDSETQYDLHQNLLVTEQE
jgi:hypothetical protein